MRRILFSIIILQAFFSHLTAQVTGTFTVGGDFDKFYPVTFLDSGFYNNVPTELSIGRSSVHINSTWRGSVIAYFRYHVTNWGNQSNFIDADIKQFNPINSNVFIAGWRDATVNNSNNIIIIWLRGGNTSYFYRSNYGVSPVIYDGTAHALPYQETNGPSHTYKTSVDSYVNSVGLTFSSNAYFNGSVTSKKVKVTQTGWPDYVFQPAYRLRPLSEVEAYIQQHHHLPDILSAEEIEKDGLDLGENQKAVVAKIEELTLYILQLSKKMEALEKELQQLKSANNK
jgi:hypothetical protein